MSDSLLLFLFSLLNSLSFKEEIMYFDNFSPIFPPQIIFFIHLNQSIKWEELFPKWKWPFYVYIPGSSLFRFIGIFCQDGQICLSVFSLNFNSFYLKCFLSCSEKCWILITFNKGVEVGRKAKYSSYFSLSMNLTEGRTAYYRKFHSGKITMKIFRQLL